MELSLQLVPLSANITIPVYNDGVSEDEEGFVVLLGVLEEELEEEDRGFVEVLSPAIVVRLGEGGRWNTVSFLDDFLTFGICRLQV